MRAPEPPVHEQRELDVTLRDLVDVFEEPAHVLLGAPDFTGHEPKEVDPDMEVAHRDRSAASSAYNARVSSAAARPRELRGAGASRRREAVREAGVVEHLVQRAGNRLR